MSDRRFVIGLIAGVFSERFDVSLRTSVSVAANIVSYVDAGEILDVRDLVHTLLCDDRSLKSARVESIMRLYDTGDGAYVQKILRDANYLHFDASLDECVA